MARGSKRAFLAGLFGAGTSDVAGSSLGAEASRALGELATCETVDGVASVLLGLAAPVGSLVGLLGLGSLIEAFQRKRELGAVTAEMRREFRAVQARLDALASRDSEQAEWIELADEVLSERLGDREPARGLEDLAAAVRASGVASQASVDEWFGGVRTYLSNIESQTRETRDAVRRMEPALEGVVDGIERIGAQIPGIARQQEETILQLSRANASLSLAVESLRAERDSLIEALESANRRLAEDRLREGRSVDEVLAELRGQDPRMLLDALAR
ncbi:MAG: hypothetical protein AAFQ17_06220 [Pseudomonadota bacterium]